MVLVVVLPVFVYSSVHLFLLYKGITNTAILSETVANSCTN